MNDVSTMGAYTFAEAARYVMAPAATIRAWFLGTTTGAGHFERVLQLDDSVHRMLSFRNLVELHVLNSIRRRHRVTLFKVRTAIAILSEAGTRIIRWPSVICLPTGTICLHMWLAC